MCCDLMSVLQYFSFLKLNILQLDIVTAYYYYNMKIEVQRDIFQLNLVVSFYLVTEMVLVICDSDHDKT